MAFDAHKNFAKATVLTGYDATALEIDLNVGQGARMPAAPFDATWWNATDYPDPADDPLREIVRVTAIATDTLTITRAQESTSANAHNTTGKTYELVAGLTAKVLTDIEKFATVVSLVYASTVATDASAGGIFDLTLTGNVTLANPTNPTNGQVVKWRIRQDNTGSRTVTLGNKFRIPSSASTPLGWSTAASKLDIFAAMYNLADDKWDVVSLIPGY